MREEKPHQMSKLDRLSRVSANQGLTSSHAGGAQELPGPRLRAAALQAVPGLCPGEAEALASEMKLGCCSAPIPRPDVHLESQPWTPEPGLEPAVPPRWPQ